MEFLAINAQEKNKNTKIEFLRSFSQIYTKINSFTIV